MTRMYIQPSFLDSCSDHGEWSGGNDQYRGDRSVDFSTFDKNGKARVEAFSDAALEANKAKRKTSIPLADRILPQAKRVRLLTEQLYELESERKAGMDIHTYSKLRDVLICKRERAEVLYRKAISVKPKSYDEDDLDLYSESSDDTAQVEAEYTLSSRFNAQPNGGYASERTAPVGVVFIDSLSETNTFKSFLKSACTTTRTLVRWHQAARNYYLTLKALRP